MKLYNRKHTALTLIEILIVLILIGILASFAVPRYVNTTAVAENREPRALLVLIRAAQLVRQLEQGTFLNCGVNCNNAPWAGVPGLGLDLPQGVVWTYTVQTATAVAFCADATGAGTSDWRITQALQQAQVGSCP